MILGPTFAPQPNEYDNHFHGKIRVAKIMEHMGAKEVEVERWIRNQKVEMTDSSFITDFRFDVYGILNNHEICVEIDTTKSGGGHLSSYARYKNNRRDEHFETKDVITVRFPTAWVWGNKEPLPDEYIIEEILCAIAKQSLKDKFSN